MTRFELEPGSTASEANTLTTWPSQSQKSLMMTRIVFILEKLLIQIQQIIEFFRTN